MMYVFMGKWNIDSSPLFSLKQRNTQLAPDIQTFSISWPHPERNIYTLSTRHEKEKKKGKKMQHVHIIVTISVSM